jgi:hypothetical protein
MDSVLGRTKLKLIWKLHVAIFPKALFRLRENTSGE